MTTTIFGTMYASAKQAARAWAATALPDPSLAGSVEDLEHLVDYWRGEARRIGETLDLTDDECLEALRQRAGL